MKTAFSTSLMGLGSASLMTLVLAWGERKRQNFRDNLREKLDQISQIKLSNSANSQGNLNIAEIMKTGFAQLIEAQNRVDSHAIGTQVGLAMTPIFQDIREELTTLKQIKADQGEAILNHLLRELRIQVIEPVVERLDQSAQLTQDPDPPAPKELPRSPSIDLPPNLFHRDRWFGGQGVNSGVQGRQQSGGLRHQTRIQPVGQRPLLPRRKLHNGVFDLGNRAHAKKQ
jgi:hypothetical protein